MENNWKKPSEKLPQQGKKILCCDKGDIFVAQRYGKYWLSIPYYDSKFSRWHEPDLWQEIGFPNGFTGKVHVFVNEEKLDIDELEKKEPQFYKEFVQVQLDLFKVSKNGKQTFSQKTDSKTRPQRINGSYKKNRREI